MLPTDLFVLSLQYWLLETNSMQRLNKQFWADTDV